MFASNEINNHYSRRFLFLIVLFWYIGIILGIHFVCETRLIVDPFSLVSTANPVPFFATFLSILIPVFFIVIALHFHLMFICILFFFVKGVSFGFSGFLIYLLFGDCGWLLRFLFLYTGLNSSTLLFFLTFAYGRTFGYHDRKSICFTFIFSCLISLLSYLCIQPCAITLLDYL